VRDEFFVRRIESKKWTWIISLRKENQNYFSNYTNHNKLGMHTLTLQINNDNAVKVIED